jgi:hypothetical protein
MGIYHSSFINQLMFLRYKFILTAAIAVAAFGTANAQKPLPNESVDVTKEFDARLLESNKINVTPTLPTLDTTTKRQNYTIPPKPLTVTYDAPKLRPVAVKGGKKEESYNGYLKAGGGVPKTFYGEAGYTLHPNEQFDGKLWLRHHRLDAGNAVENQASANTDVLASGNYFMPQNLAVEGKVGYSADRYHFYGYNRDTLSFDREAVRQDFKIFDLGGRLYNSERTDADLNFSVAPKFYLLNDYYSNKETGFDLTLNASKWFAEKHPLRLIIRTDLTRYEDTSTQKLNNIYLQPSFTFHTNILKLKVGGNFASNRDVFSIFPDAELTLRVFGDGIQIFAGANGDLRKNTYRSMSEYNPFIQSRLSELRNTKYRNYYGGVKGNLGWLDYNAQASYAQASDLALFQTAMEDRTGIARFRTVYDTANIFSLQGTIKFSPMKNLVISGTLNQSVFSLNNELHAWGLPGLEGNFNGIYSLLDGKASVKAGLYIADRINQRNETDVADKSGALLDLNLGGTYRFTKNIGAFLDINNLLNNRRERWFRYPMVGTNFLVGLTARF